MAQNVHLKVKRLIRNYFEDLWRAETGLLKTKHETEKTMQEMDTSNDKKETERQDIPIKGEPK